VTVRAVINGEPHELEPGATLALVVARLEGVPEGRGVAVALDGEVVPQRLWADTPVADGARVELVVAVQGG
jgi:sulfur carrier protein